MAAASTSAKSSRSACPAVLVCGGAGYIASHVVRALQAAGARCVVLDDFSTGHRESVPVGVEFVAGSIGDRGVLDGVLSGGGFGAVMHFCASAYVGESVENPRKYYRNNLVGGLTLLEAMLDHGVRRIVFSSSCAVYGLPQRLPLDEDCAIRPISPYGRTKAFFEAALGDFDRAYGLRWAALRYFNAAGAAMDGAMGEDHDPETHLIPAALRQALRQQGALPAGEELQIHGDDYGTPDGTCVRDYIHVEDLAEAHLRAMDYLVAGGPSEALNLANGAGFSVRQVIDACRRVTGVDIRCRIGPRRPGDPAQLVGSARRATEVLGWRPRIPGLGEIVASAWRWHCRHPRGYAGCIRPGAGSLSP